MRISWGLAFAAVATGCGGGGGGASPGGDGGDGGTAPQDGAIDGDTGADVTPNDAGGDATAGLQPVTIVTLDQAPVGTTDGGTFTAYGTFQSHYQKTVENAHGIFAAYAKSYETLGVNGGADDPSTWVIQRSTNGGATWAPIWTYSSNGSKAPCLETDAAGNLYAAFPTNDITDADFSALYASEGYSPPHTVPLPGAGAGKYSCAFDEATHQFFLLGWTDLTRVDTNAMTILDQRQAFTPGTVGGVEYPHIVFEADSSELGIAWTTVPSTPLGFGNGGYPYMDIRFAESWDKGTTWGIPWVGNNLSLPIVADQSGSAPRALIEQDYDAFATATPSSPVQNWLDSFVPVDGYFFFMYLHQQGNQWATRLTRYSCCNGSAAPLQMMQLRGETLVIESNGAFLVTRALGMGGHVIYAVGATEDPKIAVLVSRDDGASWHDWAVSDVLDRAPYAITGARKVTSDGFLIGEFTDSPKPGDTNAAIRFFKVHAM